VPRINISFSDVINEFFKSCTISLVGVKDSAYYGMVNGDKPTPFGKEFREMDVIFDLLATIDETGTIKVLQPTVLAYDEEDYEEYCATVGERPKKIVINSNNSRLLLLWKVVTPDMRTSYTLKKKEVVEKGAVISFHGDC